MFFKAIFVGAFLVAQAMANSYDGIATHYNQTGVPGSCGQPNCDPSRVVSLSNFWQQNQAPSPYCGRSIRITNTGGEGPQNYGVGTTIEATVSDTCAGCKQGDLDLSVGAFTALTGGPMDPPGTINVHWQFI